MELARFAILLAAFGEYRYDIYDHQYTRAWINTSGTFIYQQSLNVRRQKCKQHTDLEEIKQTALDQLG